MDVSGATPPRPMLELLRPRDQPLVIGLDVGGANLKAADTSGRTADRNFPLWKDPQGLPQAIEQTLATFPAAGHLAITMTGELADCYEDAGQGVREIVAAVKQATARAQPSARRSVRFYGIESGWVDADQACANPDDLAAANWHVLASFVARGIDQPSLLIDIGSTTCDLIPLAPQVVATGARTDFDRLRQAQLLYFGARRTPVCSLVSELPVDGESVPVMNELFATTDDCSLVLGKVAECPDDFDTADGRSRTQRDACRRLAKLVGRDLRTFTLAHAQQASRAVFAAIQNRLQSAIERQPACTQSILSGHGSWLAAPSTQHRAGTPESEGAPRTANSATARTLSLTEKLGASLSRVAPAYAAAVLRQQELLESAKK